MCACKTEVETTQSFFNLPQDKNALKTLKRFLNLHEKYEVNVLLYGYQINKPKSFNQSIRNNVISYVKATARFDKQLVSFKQ